MSSLCICCSVRYIGNIKVIEKRLATNTAASRVLRPSLLEEDWTYTDGQKKKTEEEERAQKQKTQIFKEFCKIRTQHFAEGYTNRQSYTSNDWKYRE